MSNVRVKVFAAHTAQELERMINIWLSQEDVELEGFDFIADGLELAYNCMVLYSLGGGTEQRGGNS